jgi:hypothetical protein
MQKGQRGPWLVWRAHLLEHDEVEVIQAVLKPKTREWLIAYAQAHPRIEALREYLKNASAVANDEEFESRYSEMVTCVSRSVGA